MDYADTGNVTDNRRSTLRKIQQLWPDYTIRCKRSIEHNK